MLAPGQAIAGANPAAEQFLGQSLRRLSGRALGDFISFDEPVLAARMGDADAQISARDTAIHVFGQGGRRVDVTLAPIIDQAGWLVLTLNDIGSAESMRENASASDNSALRAPEILAHEIKNPLAGIRGAAQLLGRKLDGNDLALTSLITDEVDRIAKLIDQMQSLSRRSAPEMSPCNLHEAVRRARAVVEIGGSAPSIAEEFDPSLPLVYGNVDALVQVLINLIANAVDACSASANPAIAVRTRFASGLQLHSGKAGFPVRLPIELRVSDNGPGIEAALRDHVFEPFVTSKKNGQGLGLALVRKLVRDMNGRITHDRDESAGRTHFRVHLPMATDRRQDWRENAA